MSKTDLVGAVLVKANDQWRSLEELVALTRADIHIREAGGAGQDCVKKCLTSLVVDGVMEKRWRGGRGGRPGPIGQRAMEYRAK